MYPDNWIGPGSAAWALGQLGDTRAVEPLIKALPEFEDTFGGEKDHIAEALGKMGEAAIEPLINALKHENLSVREGAAWALGQLGDTRAVEPLILALRSRHTRRSAAEALGKMGEAAAIEPLILALRSRHTRRGAAEALGKMGRLALQEVKNRVKGDDMAVRWSVRMAFLRWSIRVLFDR